MSGLQTKRRDASPETLFFAAGTIAAGFGFFAAASVFCAAPASAHTILFSAAGFHGATRFHIFRAAFFCCPGHSGGKKYRRQKHKKQCFFHGNSLGYLPLRVLLVKKRMTL
ncbi:MAG: hypothetical protein PHS61_00135 [Candidatus Omnitrophica bacterium]|nr:hypothetical protein [Candidatus Omnitrophota bacterium]